MDSDPFLFVSANILFYATPVSSIIALVISLILLIFLSFVSAAENALFSISEEDREEIEEIENRADKKIQDLFEDRDQVLTSLFIWKTFVNVSIIILSLFALNQMLDFSQNQILWILIELLALTLLIITFGEIIPKFLLGENFLSYIRKTAGFLKSLDIIVSPLSKFLLSISSSVNRSSKRKVNDVSVDELSKALELTSDELTEEKEMLQGIIGLYNKTADEIMTPRTDIADLDIQTNFKELIQYIIEVGYSRIPVYSGNQDDIRGILYSKDLLPNLNKHAEFRWQTLIRPAFFVPENKKIDDLLEDFRKNKIHMAIVVDEFGGTSGIVTMEDILEEIVGEIDDEYDDEEVKYTSQPDGSFIFDAKISLQEFFRIAKIDPKIFGNKTEEADTLAGLILEIKGDFPEEKEIVRFEDYAFEILEMDKKRILKTKFCIEKQPDDSSKNER